VLYSEPNLHTGLATMISVLSSCLASTVRSLFMKASTRSLYLLGMVSS